MRYYRDHHHAGLASGSAVAIGNFDGVHRGHQALLDAAAAGAPAGALRALVTFEPLPRAWFDPSTAPARLTGPAQKLGILHNEGVELVWMLRFNGQLASMSADRFTEQILLRGLNAKLVVVGGDFRFGHQREGDVDMLHAQGRQHGFEVKVVPPVQQGQLRISSTGIRAALAAGDLQGAEQMLGRPYSVLGRVVRGRQLGRTLGYPTANIRPWGDKPALSGIYAVQARLGDGCWRDGVASVGVRPAAGGGPPLIEVHLLDFNGDCYGQRLETRFLHKLRDEENFDSLDDLVVQMKQDEANARRLLASRALPTP